MFFESFCLIKNMGLIKFNVSATQKKINSMNFYSQYFFKYCLQMLKIVQISNGNRTEWSPIIFGL